MTLSLAFRVELHLFSIANDSLTGSRSSRTTLFLLLYDTLTLNNRCL